MKKRSKEITGSQVISIADGVQIGKIKGLVVNPAQKAVDFLLLDDGGEELKGIPFRSAAGIGEYAITVENKSAVIHIMQIGVLQDLVEQGIDIIGTKIITNKGKFLGDAAEYALDTSTGSLAEVIFKGEDGAEKSLPAQAVITLGKEVLVVNDNTAPEQVESGGKEEEKANFKRGDEGSQPVETTVETTEKTSEEAKSSGADIQPDAETAASAALSAGKSDPDPELDPAEVFVQRQRQYLLGKTLIKDIKTDQGEVLAWENDVITEELFNRVYELGTQKLMELAMSVRD